MPYMGDDEGAHHRRLKPCYNSGTKHLEKQDRDLIRIIDREALNQSEGSAG